MALAGLKKQINKANQVRHLTQLVFLFLIKFDPHSNSLLILGLILLSYIWLHFLNLKHWL